ncbi:hypothetical protein [Humisphaera borealis]|uniref:Uncharacterized protein n=1 Tax=Humisphaera borealis TaxID=2807512 RepID=A0A7M2WR52_9BACT|nr:hypothetical protein [Humisphaera borealis]QOV87988.1 hypothetical protein IPV69_17160 [Humisphaera borealis]
MNTSDADTISAVSTGDDASLQQLLVMAKVNAAYARLEKVAAEKFGDPRSVLAYPRARDHYAVMARNIDSAPETVNGEVATIGQGLGSIQLRKVGSQWKVDRARHVGLDASSASANEMAAAMASAYNDVADGIASAKLSSADEAKAVLMGRTQQAVLSFTTSPIPQPAATRPASLPAK